MFDLPVVKREERKAATDFRKALLDMGFEMVQFSVYIRFCTSHSQTDSYCRRVEEVLPDGGKVNILFFTDKQYERIISYVGTTKQATKKAPDQYLLF